MEPFIVRFEDLSWQAPLPGVRFKAAAAGGKQLRIAEFTAEFVEPHWCEKGHVGLLLEGDLEVQFHDGRTVTYHAGDGLIIPPGPASAHKARALTPLARLVLVEEP